MTIHGYAEGTERVAVVGAGAVTCFGLGVDALWSGVSAGRVGIVPVHAPDIEALGTFVGAAVPAIGDSGNGHRPDPEPTVEFALLAAREALEQAAWLRSEVPASRWAVIIGTCNGGLTTVERFFGAAKRDPRLLQQLVPHSIAEAVAAEYGLGGPCLTFSTACSSSTVAVGFAADLVRRGIADAVLAGGSDAFSQVTFAGFYSMEALSPEPTRPFTRGRLGLSIGEGSGMLVLTSMRRPGAAARSLGEIAGYGISADGYHPTAPHPEGEGASRAIAAALSSAGVEPRQVGYVNAHGTGTPKNDGAETRAIHAAFGETAPRLAVSSTKSMIGHLMGAAGAVEAIVTLKALQEQVAPPTAGYEAPDPECDLDYVPNHSHPLATDVAISSSFAFAGHNAAIVLRRAGSSSAPQALADAGVVVTGVALLEPGPAADGARIRRIEFDLAEFISAREARRMDRLTLLSLAAAHRALADAGLTVTSSNRGRVGVVMGSCVGPAESLEAFVTPILAEGLLAANPALFPSCVQNAVAGHIATRTGAVGPSLTINAGLASSAAALAGGFELVRSGRADAIVCVAADSPTDLVADWYRSLMAPNSDQAEVAESAVCIILESESSAAARGAVVQGRLRGWGSAFSAGGHGDAGALAEALAGAGVVDSAVVRSWSDAVGRPAPLGASAMQSAALALHAHEQGVHVIDSSSHSGTSIALVLEVGDH